MKSQAFQALLSKKMTRREFLFYLGTLVFVLSGVAGILETVTTSHQKVARSKPKVGFGSGAYGG